MALSLQVDYIIIAFATLCTLLIPIVSLVLKNSQQGLLEILNCLLLKILLKNTLLIENNVHNHIFKV